MSWRSRRALLIYVTWDWEDWTIGFTWNDERLIFGGPWWGIVIRISYRIDEDSKPIGFRGPPS